MSVEDGNMEISSGNQKHENMTNEDESNGRYDDFGKFVKNLEHMPDLLKKLEKFRTERKLSPTAVIITFLQGNKDLSEDDVYECMKTLEVDFSIVKDVYRVRERKFRVDFNDMMWKKHVISTINKFHSDKYEVYSVVQDLVKVTLSGLPSHIEDTDVLEFLGVFGGI